MTRRFDEFGRQSGRAHLRQNELGRALHVGLMPRVGADAGNPEKGLEVFEKLPVMIGQIPVDGCEKVGHKKLILSRLPMRLEIANQPMKIANCKLEINRIAWVVPLLFPSPPGEEGLGVRGEGLPPS